MNSKILKSLIIVAVLSSVATASNRITGAGASFPAPCYYEWAYNYAKDTKVRINYQAIGSGGGIKQITERIVDFGATDSPLKPKELDKKQLLQFPALVGAIVVVYNLDGIADEKLRLKNSTVADIFAGKITMWNDSRIASDNPDLKLPAQKIIPIHRSDSSGTTEVFTQYLSQSSKHWKQNYGVGKTIRFASGIGAKGNEGVTNMIKQMPNSIGYIENGYKERNALTAATLQTSNDRWVKARPDNFKTALKKISWSKESHFYGSLVMQPDSYPIMAATYILLPRDKDKVKTTNEIVRFIDYSFRGGDEVALRLGYIPLSVDTTNLVRQYINENR